MKRACVLYADEFLRHGEEDHIENQSRLSRTMVSLARSEIATAADLLRPGVAEDAQICAVHDPKHLQHIKTFAGGKLDEDTSMTEGSLTAALLAAGAAVDCVDEVFAGRELAFGMVRPPGHHAMPDHAMGFCIFNNVAIGAAHALSRARRVLIVDWDVHHGNGTERMFYSNPAVLFFSVHQYPHYPGTGAAENCGTGDGEGYNVNVPLPAGSTDADVLGAFQRVLVPIADDYRPDLVMVSAGYDACESDPLGSLKLTENGFQSLACTTRAIAKHKGVAALLEGGYSSRLPGCVEASIHGFLGEDAAIGAATTEAAQRSLDEVVRVQKKYWRL
jgi:acetoin utilization deacetylase AcuC-like enzyme